MKKFFMIFILQILFFTGLALNAEDTNYLDLFNDEKGSKENKDNKNETTGTTLTPDFKLSLSGEHSFEFHMPVIKDDFSFERYAKAPRFNNTLGISINYKILKVVSEWQLDLKLNEFGDISDVLLAQPLENSITLSPWRFKIGAGFQFFKWGTADKGNPTDNINPRDWRDGLDPKKLSVLSAFVKFYLPGDFMSMEAVYVPFEMKNKYPRDFAAEIPKKMFNAINMQFISGTPPAYFDMITAPVTASYDKDVKIIEPDFDPASLLAGGKFNFNFAHADFSLNYLYDVDPFYTPVIDIQEHIIRLVKPGDPTMDGMPLGNMYRPDSIKLERKRVHRFGADFRTTAGAVGLWFEICYTMTEDYLMKSYKLRNHKLSWVTGFDLRYGPNSDFYLNIEYMGEFIPEFDGTYFKDYEDGLPDQNKMDDKKYVEKYYYRTLVNELGAEREGLLQGISTRMEWPVINSLLTPKITAVYYIPLLYDYGHELRYGSLIANPELDIMPIDSLHILIGAELFFSWYQPHGKAVQIDFNDRLGTYHNDSNVYLIIKYKWGFDFVK